jgi:hypothetical protein
LIIRAWYEPDGGFRARILEVDDPPAGEQSVAVATGPDEVLRRVERWMQLVALGGPRS